MFCYRYEDPVKGVICGAISDPIYVIKQSNGVVVRCEEFFGADGVVSPNGYKIYRLKGKTALSEEYREIEPITMAEYEKWMMLNGNIPEPDPEDIAPDFSEDVEPKMVLNRAVLSQKIVELEDILMATKIMLGVEE